MLLKFLICGAGLIMIISEIIFRFNLRRIANKIPAELESDVNVYFIIGEIGLWVFLFSAGVIVFRLLSLDPRWFVLVGIGTGIISAIRDFVFLGFITNKIARNPAMGETMGGMALGCMVMVVLPLLGAAAGYIMYRIMI